MYLNHNVPPFECFVRKEFLTNFKESGFISCYFVSVKALRHRALTFQVLTEDGALYDKLPINAFTTNKDAPLKPTDVLQLWDCPSYHLSVIRLQALINKKAQVFLKTKDKVLGNYLFTIDFSEDSSGETSVGFAETASEHKCAHIIELDDGNLTAQPNNRILWYDPSLGSSPFDNPPGYKVARDFQSVESHPKWSTDDSDSWFYKVNEHID